MNALQATTISAAFVFGMVLALLGSLKLALAKRLQLGEGRIGGLLSALNVAVIPMMVLTGILIDRWGVGIVLILCSAITAVAVLILSAQPTYRRAFIAVLAAGLGASGLSTAAIVLMPQAFFGEQAVPASLNLGFVFVALGALLTPALTDLLLRWLEFRRTAALLALVCLVPAVVGLWNWSALPPPAGQGAAFGDLLNNPFLWLAALVFLFYVPLEGAISVWATTYLTDQGIGERGAAWLLSGFWAAFLTSRLAVAFLEQWLKMTPFYDKMVLVLAAGGAAVVVGNLIGSAQSPAGRWWLVILGFVLGPIFPTLLGLLFEVEAFKSQRGTAYGVVFAAGSVGSLVMAPLIGFRARRSSVLSALWIPLALGLALVIASLAFGLTTVQGPTGR